jgi:hypothetical protein
MTSHPLKGLRQFVRIPFDADVLLKVGPQTVRVHLLDISLKGAMLQLDGAPHFHVHDACRLKLPMANDGTGIVMAGRIAHRDEDLIGVECLDIDVRSLTRLRRLIELNSGDASLADREVRQLFGG